MFKKIVFMGTPEFSVPILKSLYQNGYPITAVFTQPPKKSKRGQKINKSAIQKMAENLSIQIRMPNYLKDNNEEYNFLKLHKPDLIIVVAYGQLIPKEYLTLSKNGFINIHASLLPKLRGAAPIQRSIMNQDKQTGISIMKIEEKLDSGPVMKQETVNIEDNMNTEQLSSKLSGISASIILDCIDEIENDRAIFKNQNNENVTYAKKIDKSEGKINWKEDALKIQAKINSLYPTPGAWFLYNGKRYKILKASVSSLEGEVGEVLNDNLTVACGTKSLKIEEVQREGKNRQNTSEFLLGSKIGKGKVLN